MTRKLSWYVSAKFPGHQIAFFSCHRQRPLSKASKTGSWTYCTSSSVEIIRVYYLINICCVLLTLLCFKLFVISKLHNKIDDLSTKTENAVSLELARVRGGVNTRLRGWKTRTRRVGIWTVQLRSECECSE